MRLFKWTGKTTAAVTTASLSFILLSIPDLATQPAAADGPQTPICAAPSSVSKIDPASGAPSSSSKAATVTRFDSRGTVVEFRVPPASWNPLTATDQELSFYGLPPRPTDAADLNSWTYEFRHYSGFGDPQYCPPAGTTSTHPQQRSESAAVTLAGHYASPNWTGLVVPQGGGSPLNYAYGHTFVPWNYANCNSDAHAAWVGLGGTDNAIPLAQDGVVDDGSGLRMWWEVLNHNYGIDSTVTEIRMAAGIHRGDEVSFSTHYFAASGSTSAHFSFYVHNYTTGEIEDPLLYGWGGYPASLFYSGSSAEAIDERIEVGGYYDELRAYGTQDWLDASDTRSNGSSAHMRSESGHYWDDMDNLAETEMLANSEILSGSSSTEFQTQFDQCGPREKVP